MTIKSIGLIAALALVGAACGTKEALGPLQPTGASGGTAVTNFVTTDANPTPTASQVEVRIINMSPAAGALDVFVTAPNADLAAATPTATNLAFHAASPYVVFAPATYQVRAVP